MNFTELSCTTWLFLMSIVGTSSLSNSFSVRNLWFHELHCKFFIIFKTPFQCTQMELTLTMNKNLLQFLRLFNNPCRVFLTHAVKDSHHLFSISLVFRLDSSCIFRIRILDEIESVFAVLAVQRITGLDIFQLHCTTYITGSQFFHLFTVSTGTNIKLSHTFLRAAVCIIQVITFVNHTTHNLKVLNITDMRFNGSLEEIKWSRSICHRRNRNTTCVVNHRHFINERHHVTKEFHQSANTHIFTCTHAEHREHTSCSQSLTDTFAHFVFCERFRFEEFLHKSFVVLGSSLNKSLMPFHSFFHFFSRNRFDSRSTTFRPPRIFFH